MCVDNTLSELHKAIARGASWNAEPYPIHLRNFLVALTLVCTDHHSGQWSRGYRLQCMSRNYLWRWFGITCPNDYVTEESKHMYDELYEKYGWSL